MDPIITDEIKEVMGAIHYQPEISIIMPFDPKMGIKTEVAHSLKIAADKVEKQLNENYPNEIGKLVIQKLRSIIKNLNYNTHKKSIAIYVSPVFEKVLYLDLPVEEKIIIDDSFEIRDLIYCKKQIHKYLVLLLSDKESKMYIGNSEKFVRILSNTPESVYAYINDAPEKVGNFSDFSHHKEIVTEKFIHHIDHSLDAILNSYNLPLFVIGTERIAGHFKKITKHASSIIEYVHGNYEEASMDELMKLLSPHVADWKKILQKNLLNKLEDAVDKKRLAEGMKDVWQAAMERRGKLLVVEKNYMYAAQHGANEDSIYKAIDPYNHFSYIKDAVDDVIEKVLESGGDIEFVDEGLLKKYNHIALVKFY